MALTIEVAKPFTWLNGFTGFSWTLTPPENAVGLVLAIADGTFTAPPEYGGLPLSQVDGTFVDLWELLDLTGASGTALVGETSFNAQVITVAWLVDDGPVVRVDFETAGYTQHSTTFTVTPDRAGCAALVVGAASSGSGVGDESLAPYTGQTQLTEGDNGPGVGATAMNMSWRGGISTPTTVGMTDDSIGTGWNGGVSAALYAPTERTILLSGITEEAGFTGLTIAPSGPAMVYLSRRPVERAGFRGLTIRASGPRNVALVGRHLGTSEMTDVPAVDTPDVAVLRYRRSAKPAFEQLADLAVEAGVGGAATALDDLTDVNAPTPGDGEALVWDDGAGEWVPGPAGASLTVEDGGAVSVAAVDTIEFPLGTVVDLTGGNVRVREVPTGVIGCSLYRTAVQSLSNGVTTDIALDSEVFDTDGFHSGSNAYVTIPAGLGGKYLVSIYGGFAPDNDGSRYIYGIPSRTPNQLAYESAQAAQGGQDTRLSATAVMDLQPGDTITAKAYQDAGNSLDVTFTMTVILLGSGNVAGLPSARAVRTSGNLTLNSTSWANVDTGLDLVVPAQVGDVLLVQASGWAEAEAVTLVLDAATIVSGSPVNYVSGTAGAAGSYGVAAWVCASGAYGFVDGGVQYVVQSGDISGGNVTLRLRYRTTTAGNKTMNAGTTVPFQWSVVNLKGGAGLEADRWHIVGAAGEPTFANSWVWYGSWTTPAFRKDAAGYVHLKGLVKDGSADAIFALPVGYRPGENHIFHVHNSGSAARLDVMTDGTVVRNGGGNSYVSLDGITFLAEG